MDAVYYDSFTLLEGCDLPVFRRDEAGFSLFYAPAYLVAAQAAQADRLSEDLARERPSSAPARRLQRQARSAGLTWRRLYGLKEFSPLCLTLYTSRRCNLKCNYCFSQGEAEAEDADLEPDFIRDGAEWVAENCARAGVPFNLVIHGGGEPTLDARLPQILALVQSVVERHNLRRFFYLASNGVMPESLARWAVLNFDQIGLSCDGPAEIQAAQRPLKNGTGSTPAVERTAAIIRGAGQALHVRATITAQSAEKMPEIAAYLGGVLKAAEVRIEPVFQGGRASAAEGWDAAQAAAFCTAFFEARRVARCFGMQWAYSGCRPQEVHGRYCQIFRDVLQLVPGNGLAACLKSAGLNQARRAGLEISSNAGINRPDFDRISALQKVLTADEADCVTCINRFHCTRGCPDACPAAGAGAVNGFRCRFNRLFITTLLQEKAQQLIPLLGSQPLPGCPI